MPARIPASANQRVARFYNVARPMYPLAEFSFARIRLELVKRVNLLQPTALLEIGVGPGRHLAGYKAPDLTVVDVSRGMIDECRRRFPRAEACVMDGEALDFPAESFDCVALPHVLTVTANPNQMITEARRVLKPRGCLAILTYEARTPLLRSLAAVWSPVGRLLLLNAHFQLTTHCPALKQMTMTENAKSGLLGQFSLSMWQK
jgi:phosphatidylethanolamine/phosphatidyl-N-methylethanolamine N-methyltransferase